MVRNSPPIQIRPIHKLVELKAVEELQREIWGCSELEVLPGLTLIPLLDIGGVLIGAYDGETLIGFVTYALKPEAFASSRQSLS